MQLITRKVVATMDMVTLKLSDLDKSIATPELVRARKDQWLEFEILNPFRAVACRAGFYRWLSVDGLGILVFGVFTARAVAGFATHIGQIRRAFNAFKSALIVAGGMALIAFFKLMLFKLGLHDGYRIP